ncbi:MAG: hypothetical protein PHE51_02340 [Eubacteriales bacterium]|nr:hypothetical protein [Eubacteriales bacterium]
MFKKWLLCLAMIAYAFIITFLVSKGIKTIYQKNTVNTTISTYKAETEDEFTLIEEDETINIYKGDVLYKELETDVTTLPSSTRTKLKKGINCDSKELPYMIESFAE